MSEPTEREWLEGLRPEDEREHYESSEPVILYRRVWNEHDDDDWPGQYEYQKFNPNIQQWIDEVVSALDAATKIGQRSCNSGDHLHYANHDRLIASAPNFAALTPGDTK